MRDFENLKKLLNHLKKGKLIHPKFDNGCFNDGAFIIDSKIPFCKVSGNSLGEMPAISKKWNFNKNGELFFECYQFENEDYSNEILRFFGLSSEKEFYHLFLKKEWIPEFGGKELDCNSTIEDVIFTIEDFIRIKELKK